ncbi:MAG: AAA family ATPase [Bacillota bacterium]|jgi:DNA helicase-2/ATP-dependent DNA helicase PcrA
MQTKEEQEREEQHLTEALKEINLQLNAVIAQTGIVRKETVATGKLMWDEYARYIYEPEDAVEIKPHLDEMRRQEDRLSFYYRLRRKLERLQMKPYFGRITFREDGIDQAQDFYIGLAALSHSGTGKPLIYDWRAPVSGMYYDFEIGRAGYQCPDGAITGELLLKRQFKITNGVLEYWFDSGLKIDDEILQRVLSQNVDERMRTIVTSIQREQNQAIRDETHRVLLVFGPAGSGKTAIALHRAAYLLYRFQDKIRAENIVIFSPNHVLSDYIAGVLPDLGEENILRTTFGDYVQSRFDTKYQVENQYQQLEFLLTDSGAAEAEIRRAGIRLKNSAAFNQALEASLTRLEKRQFDDLYYREYLIMSAAAFTELFTQKLTYLPLGKRLAQIKQRALYLLEPLRRERARAIDLELINSDVALFPKERKALARIRAHQEFESPVAKLEQMCHIDTMQCYDEFWQLEKLQQTDLAQEFSAEQLAAISRQTRERVQNGILYFEDIVPFLYLDGLLWGFRTVKRIKHLIFDEAQDYSVLQLRLLHKIFSGCTMTILGDYQQQVHPLLPHSNPEALAGIFSQETTGLVRLTKSYRSTRQINDFARAVLGKTTENTVMEFREGDKPLLIKLPSKTVLGASLLQQIRRLQATGCRSVAIICKTMAAGLGVYEILAKQIAVNLITTASAKFCIGPVVLPVYLAKGLEFDAVIVCGVEAGNYSGEFGRKLLYIACTRALHRLQLVYTDELAAPIQEINRKLYDMSIFI